MQFVKREQFADLEGTTNVGSGFCAHAPKALLSTSATAPTMPTSYDRKRRIGWVRNNARSNFVHFNQRGDDETRLYYYDEDLTNLNVLTGGSALAFTDVDLSAFVPPTDDLAILLCGFLAPVAAGAATDTFNLRPKGANSADGPWVFPAGNSIPASRRWTFEIPTDTNRFIRYKVTDADDEADMWVLGYYDEI